MEEKKKLFVAWTVEKNEGHDAESFVLGVYSSREKAEECLERQFEDDKGMLNIDDNEWERTDINNGFRYAYDDYNYFEYHIDEKMLDD